MARPRVADVGTASDMEGSWEYIEYGVADSRRGVDLQFVGLGVAITTPPREKQTVKKYAQARCFLWRQTNPVVKRSPARISGGGGVFLEEVSLTREKEERYFVRGRMAGGCAYSNELSGFHKMPGNFLISCKTS
jgi:hypothetical protein